MKDTEGTDFVLQLLKTMDYNNFPKTELELGNPKISTRNQCFFLSCLVPMSWEKFVPTYLQLWQ